MSAPDVPDGSNPMEIDSNTTTGPVPEGAQPTHINPSGDGQAAAAQAVATTTGSRLQPVGDGRRWTLQEIMAAVKPDFGERLNWISRAAVSDQTSTEPRARSIYNRPSKEAADYAPSALAEHAKFVVRDVIPEIASKTLSGSRRMQRFVQPVEVEGSRVPPSISRLNMSETAAPTPIAYVRAISASGMARMLNANEGRAGRKIGVLVNSDSTEKTTFGLWETGVRNQQTDLMHTTTLADSLCSVLPLKDNEIILLNNHVVWASDLLGLQEVRLHAPVEFIVASATKLSPKGSQKAAPQPDGTTRWEYSGTREQLNMRHKMESIIHVAANDRIKDLVLGSFGYGDPFNHPADELAMLWTKIILDNATKWRNLGMKFHFALPLGAGCRDELWTAFQTAMHGHAEAFVDVDGSDTSNIIKQIRGD